jgi:hypothetical protein
MKSRHFKWVPHFLNDDLRVKRVEGVAQLLDVLKAQQKCGFRDLITGDETWVFLDMKPRIVWAYADAELPLGVKRTIASGKRMLIVFWGIRGITHYCWLPEDSTLDSSFLCEEVLSPIAEKLQVSLSKTRKPFTLIHMDNARVHIAHVTQQKLEVSRFERALQPPHSPDIAPSDFFLFGWLKAERERREYEGEDG